MTIEQLVTKARQDRASDIHLIYGLPPKYRKDGQLENMSDTPLTLSDCVGYARELSGTPEAYDIYLQTGELDAAETIAGNRCRIHIFRQQGAPSVALRLLSDVIPRLDTLGLPPAALKLPELHKGIVLVTGETGSGKSTTLASILNQINLTRPDHIITLEDPIEYVYTPQLCSIDQREIGRDTVSYAEGLRAILREDPDVILIGEMRDLDTIETALTAAETGHLVFGTLHTQSAADSVDRLVDVFPEGRQRQIRLQLSMVLKAVLSQQLLPRVGEGRAVACEVMIVNHAIRNLIREGKTPQIENTLATTAELGSITMDNMLIQMVRNRTISREVAMQAARDSEYIKRGAR